MTATITTTDTEHAPATKRPVLHAFPENSLVALCGRTRKHLGNISAAGKDRCPTCLHEAGRKAFVTR